MELVIRSITPAVVQMNIEEVEKYMQEVKEKYVGWVVSEEEIGVAKEERTKLNKLEKNISDVRKRIEKEGMSSIKDIIETLKNAEKETKMLSNNIGTQIKEFEEKEWETKQEEISEIIDNVFRENPELKLYITENSKWKNKGMTLNKIETELEEQFSSLSKKYNFILGQLKSVNEEIENKLSFKDIQYLMNCEFDEIMKTLVNKKNEIKATEENIKKRAEEEKRRALEELERKKEQEKKVAVEEAIKKEVTENSHISSTAKEKEVSQTNIPSVEKNAENEKYFDTTIRFENAPLSFLKELKALSDKYEIKYQLLENIEL
jgi:putative DNA double-strand break repair rad50 ATPase (fragment)